MVTPTSILDAIAEVLSNKSEKDDKLTHLFEHVRSVSLTLVKELFGDFRSKLSLGNTSKLLLLLLLLLLYHNLIIIIIISIIIIIISSSSIIIIIILSVKLMFICV